VCRVASHKGPPRFWQQRPPNHVMGSKNGTDNCDLDAVGFHSSCQLRLSTPRSKALPQKHYPSVGLVTR
jgi:hypothetical protein